MGHKDNGAPRLFPDPKQLVIHIVARDLVKSSKGLVHQQQLRIVGQARAILTSASCP
jgi:hypothetical protein